MYRKTPDQEIDELLDEDIASVQHRERVTFDNLTGLSKNSLVIYGAGNLGRKILIHLRQLGIEPLAFVDNDPSLWNKEINGLLVHSIEDGSRLFGKSAATIVAIFSPGPERSYRKIRKFLNDSGFAHVVSPLPLFWKYPTIFFTSLEIGFTQSYHYREK